MLLGLPQLIVELLSQPAFGRGIKGNRQPYGHFRADNGLAVEYGAQRFAADVQCFGGSRYGKAEGLQAQLAQDFAGMGGLCINMCGTSVVIFIVYDLGITCFKAKGYSPVAVDRHRPDATTLAAECMQSQAG